MNFPYHVNTRAVVRYSEMGSIPYIYWGDLSAVPSRVNTE